MKKHALMFILILTVLSMPAQADSGIVYSPDTSSVTICTGESYNFNVSVATLSSITWYIDGNIVQQDENSIFSEYTFMDSYTDSHTVKVTTDNGESVLTKQWNLQVLPAFNVTFSPDEKIITSRLDRKPVFTVSVNETSDILWYLDNELIKTYNDVSSSNYTPSLSENGNYSIDVHVTNDNGTVWKQWCWVATATPSQIMTGGSGGGGSSSGSVASGEDSDNILTKEVQMLIVNKGRNTTYSFEEETNPIDSVKFVSSVNAGYVKTTVEVLKDRSSTVSKNPEDKVYSYMNINLGNTGLESKLSDTRIMFHIDTQWINENSIDADSIRLNVFSGSGWKRFPVVFVEQNGSNMTYISTTTEFGSFAITGKSNQTEDDVVVIDMSGNAAGKSDNSSDGSDASNTDSDKQNALVSVLHSMTDLFIKRNPLNS